MMVANLRPAPRKRQGKPLIWLAMAVVALAVHGAPAAAQIAPPRFSEAAFAEWLSHDPARAPAFAAFQAYLIEQHVNDVAPAFQLWRTSSSSATCHADAFVAPPREFWPHVAKTLAFVRDRVKPDIGAVEVVSAYRDEALNACSGGARLSAHRLYFALDMVPLDAALTRTELVRRVCALHAAYGAASDVGLGFYSGVRFHIDTMRYRRWGADGRGVTSPCAGLPPR